MSVRASRLRETIYGRMTQKTHSGGIYLSTDVIKGPHLRDSSLSADINVTDHLVRITAL